MSFDRNTQHRSTIVVNQTLSVAAPSFTVYIGQLVNFRPKYMIIRQLLYSNITGGTDLGTYLIWSSIRGDNIGAVYVGIQGVALTPGTVIQMPIQSQSIDFRVTPANAGFPGPTGVLTMTLEFIEND